MKYLVNLLYYKHNAGHGNFGDELSVFITSKLINTLKYKLLTRTKGIRRNIVCIGSYIHKARPGSYIFGSGIRKPDVNINPYLYKTLKICAVRGPKSREYLVNMGVKVPEIFGDPALLLPIFYKAIIEPRLCDKIGIIPHMTNYNMYYTKLSSLDTTKYELINPTDHWATVINKLASCKCIVSSSLHGLICADAYGVPNIWLTEYE